jgi:hypothetical protein
MKNKYSHAVALSIIGVIILMMNVPYPEPFYRFIGGFIVGWALVLARQQGRDEK